ncbi:hypothetical protein N7526_008237 [Penicillium atrosanguineum]|nr:hypothetical protein N7526_008237 [Penicillium atrosanguineum]
MAKEKPSELEGPGHAKDRDAGGIDRGEDATYISDSDNFDRMSSCLLRDFVWTFGLQMPE